MTILTNEKAPLFVNSGKLPIRKRRSTCHDVGQDFSDLKVLR